MSYLALAIHADNPIQYHPPTSWTRHDPTGIFVKFSEAPEKEMSHLEHYFRSEKRCTVTSAYSPISVCNLHSLSRPAYEAIASVYTIGPYDNSGICQLFIR